MTLTEKLKNNKKLKFSFGKDTKFQRSFCYDINACSMYLDKFGLNIDSNLSSENQIRGVFNRITKENGIFVFNINGVDIIKAGKGFNDFTEAQENNMITEWELFIILSNRDYLKRTIFHNEKIEFEQVKNSLKIAWK
jgi:hypothetical protein